MYVIVIYDMKADRTRLLRKPLREYLVHVQQSVFAGQTTKAEAENIEELVSQVIDPGKEESGIVYKFNSEKYIDKISVGEDPSNDDQFI